MRRLPPYSMTQKQPTRRSSRLRHSLRSALDEVVDVIAESVRRKLLENIDIAYVVGDGLEEDHDQGVELPELLPADLPGQLLEELGHCPSD